MNIFLKYVFIFLLGSIIGWIIELIYRRILHSKWVNPGFLVGPYLPIYGFGLVLMNVIYLYFDEQGFSIIASVVAICLCMTLLELVSGLIFLKAGVKLWDYSDNKFNYKGIICPTYSLIWLLAALFYIYFIESKLNVALDWYSNNISFSYVTGFFSGILALDFVYSTKLYNRIKKFAKSNNINIIYEKLKIQIKEFQDTSMQKYSFITPFRQTRSLFDYLADYVKNNQLFGTDKPDVKKKEKKR